jgi:hypothetical protein
VRVSFFFSSASEVFDLLLQEGDAPAQDLVAAVLAPGVAKFVRHLEGIDAQIVRSHVVATEALNLSSSVLLQLGAHAFGSLTQGHRDVAVTNPQPVGQHNSIIAQVEAL